jgi:hypothetical protein
MHPNVETIVIKMMTGQFMTGSCGSGAAGRRGVVVPQRSSVAIGAGASDAEAPLSILLRAT